MIFVPKRVVVCEKQLACAAFCKSNDELLLALPCGERHLLIDRERRTLDHNWPNYIFEKINVLFKDRNMRKS